ncbi:MAG: hypothetical protein RLZZ53_2506 [Acidobacteriota bacterium]|jgi:hypothetical protein
MTLHNIEPSGMTEHHARGKMCWRDTSKTCVGSSCMAWQWTQLENEYAWVRLGRKPIDGEWTMFTRATPMVVGALKFVPWKRPIHFSQRHLRLGRCGAVPSMARTASIEPSMMPHDETQEGGHE